MTRINALTLALKSLRHKPLSTTVNLVLMAIGVAMMSFVLSASQQLEDKALRDAQGIDLVRITGETLADRPYEAVARLDSALTDAA